MTRSEIRAYWGTLGGTWDGPCLIAGDSVAAHITNGVVMWYASPSTAQGRAGGGGKIALNEVCETWLALLADHWGIARGSCGS